MYSAFFQSSFDVFRSVETEMGDPSYIDTASSMDTVDADTASPT